MKARTAHLEDRTAVADLWRRFMAEERVAIPKDAEKPNLDAWSARLDAQLRQGKLVVAERHGTLVGFAGFVDSADEEWVPMGIAYVVDVYVIPEMRRLGTARELFLFLLERLVCGGYNEVWTNTSTPNARAQSLLRRARFVPLQDFRIAGLSDHLYFGKSLSTPSETQTLTRRWNG